MIYHTVLKRAETRRKGEAFGGGGFVFSILLLSTRIKLVRILVMLFLCIMSGASNRIDCGIFVSNFPIII